MAGGGQLPSGPGPRGVLTFDEWLAAGGEPGRGRRHGRRRVRPARAGRAGDGGREAALAVAYQQARPRLVRVAYAVLGSHAEAEDVVSDCWLRLAAADAREPVLDVEAWATVTVARAALDALRSARRRREVYVGPWLPEPVVGLETVAGAGPPGPTRPTGSRWTRR